MSRKIAAFVLIFLVLPAVYTLSHAMDSKPSLAIRMDAKITELETKMREAQQEYGQNVQQISQLNERNTQIHDAYFAASGAVEIMKALKAEGEKPEVKAASK